MMMFRRRVVRVHQNDPAPTVEGILVGKPWDHAGHYVVRKPSVLTAPEHSVPLDANEVWIPREKVVFLEVMR